MKIWLVGENKHVEVNTLKEFHEIFPPDTDRRLYNLIKKAQRELDKLGVQACVEASVTEINIRFNI
jgi:hypothetical protein